MPLDLVAWLRTWLNAYSFDVAGVFHREGDHPWPFVAEDASSLEQGLAASGHLLPLPKEPAALANILEVSVVDFLARAADGGTDITLTRGTERGYPDIELHGDALGGFHAVDVKVARRDPRSRQPRTESRITLYTGNTYFRFPSLHWPGTFRPFDEYASHVDVIVIYSLNPDTASRVDDVELIVQDAWRIGSRQRSSTTREYIGAVTSIEALREGVGDFTTQAEFYRFWRAYPFRLSTQVQRQLDRLVHRQRAELDALRLQVNATTDKET